MIRVVRRYAPLGLVLIFGCTSAPPTEGHCAYAGYGSQCVIPCNVSTDLRFDVRVAWSGSYSCTSFGPYENFRGCRCRNGFVECPRNADLWGPPSSTCEFFPDGRDVGTSGGPDANVSFDAFTPDAPLDASTPDADLDAFTPDANETICDYVDYGSTCHMPCAQPPEERFTARVRWDSTYCCTFIHGPYETFEGCRCSDGFVECPYGGDLWGDPQSRCEFCPGTPSGSVGDT